MRKSSGISNAFYSKKGSFGAGRPDREDPLSALRAQSLT